jgi:hypothetical protein
MHCSSIGHVLQAFVPHLQCCKSIRFDPDTTVTQIKQWLLSPCTTPQPSSPNVVHPKRQQQQPEPQPEQQQPEQQQPEQQALASNTVQLATSPSSMAQSPAAPSSLSSMTSATSGTIVPEQVAVLSVPCRPTQSECLAAMAEHAQYQLQVANIYPPIVFPDDQPLATCAVGVGVTLQLVRKSADSPTTKPLSLAVLLIVPTVPAPLCYSSRYHKMPQPTAIVVQPSRLWSVRTLIHRALVMAAAFCSTSELLAQLAQFTAYLQHGTSMKMLNPHSCLLEHASIFDETTRDKVCHRARARVCHHWLTLTGGWCRFISVVTVIVS